MPRDAADAGVDGQPRLPRAAPAPGARRGSRSSRRAARRSRSGARRRVGRHPHRSPRVVQATLADFGLVGWPKTSGSRGMHVYVRIEPKWTFDQVRRAALAFAREVERRAPGLATSKWWKEERHGVFLDYNQNAKDRTIAGAYSVRPTPDARVSAPLAWDEIDACEPGDFTLATMPARFAALGDRHAGIDDRALVARARCSSSRRATSARARATRRGRRNTRSRRGSRRACSRRAAACRAVRSSRSAAPQRKEDALAGLERWRARHPERRRISLPPTCSWTRCAAGFAPGRASASTCRMCRSSCGPPQEALDPDAAPNEWEGVSPDGAPRRRPSRARKAP